MRAHAHLIERGEMTPELFILAYGLDVILGDPEWLPHPVRAMGWAIRRGEARLRRRVETPAGEFLAGMTLSLMIVGAFGMGTAWLLRALEAWNSSAAAMLLAALAWTTLATRSLIDEAHAVDRFLQRNDLERARRQLSRIVGRDTERLDEAEIVRATIETVAESASDGIVAPLLYLALGGVPMAMAYKAVNTLDSMIGYDNARYRYFGLFAARLDDVANFVPARLTALLIVIAAFITGYDGGHAWQIWRRDGAQHASPNAGHPEAAMAGALGVRLGGLNTYQGEPFHGAHLGEPRNPLDRRGLRASLKIVAVVSLLMSAIVFGWLRWQDGG